jgi:drug/metabolite transporter (DMT)-like permease
VNNPTANQRGIVLMLAAMACYVMNDALVKLTTQYFPPGQILAVRGVFATVVMFTLARGVGGAGHWRRLVRPIVGFRCALEIATAVSSVLALSFAPLATVTTIMMTAPLTIAVGVIALGWEPLRGGRILAALAGFAGVVLVLRPFARQDGPAWGIWFALACALSLAARDLVTRRIPPGIPSVMIAMSTTMAVCLAGLAFGLHETWQSLGSRETAILAVAAVCAALGNYALIAACRDVDLSVVTPFRYSIIVWAMLLGYVWWGDVPDAMSALGIVLIVAGGVYAVHTNRL